MRAKPAALIVVLALGLALAQTTDSHTVTVTIPSILTLQIDATDFHFDFTSNATGNVTVYDQSYPKASQEAYDNFLDTATGPQTFAPSAVAGTGGNDHATMTIRTNRAQWTVQLTPGGNLAAPLSNGRLRVFVQKVSGKGSSWTGVPTTVPGGGSSITVASASANGQGKSFYHVFFILELDPNDDIPLTGYTSQITINYTLSSP